VHPEGRTVSRDHPLRLANAKAKSLKSLLSRTRAARQRDLPYVDAAVYLSDPQLEVRLDEAGRKRVFGRAARCPGRARDATVTYRSDPARATCRLGVRAHPAHGGAPRTASQRVTARYSQRALAC
jgi:hypothetical protein